jgi:hypothetical protein
MAAAEVDLAYLSSHAGVPEADLDTAVSAPTADLVASVLGAIVTKLRDLEQDKFQLGVELETAFRGAESRYEQFNGTSDKALKEVEGQGRAEAPSADTSNSRGRATRLSRKWRSCGRSCRMKASPRLLFQCFACLAMSANMLSTQNIHAGLSRMNPSGVCHGPSCYGRYHIVEARWRSPNIHAGLSRMNPPQASATDHPVTVPHRRGGGRLRTCTPVSRE